MAQNEKRRQKKLEARKAKRKEQKRAVARFQSSGMNARMAVAKNWPIVDVRISSTLWEYGLGYVAVVRGRQRQVAAAIFLVDVFCLGVKDVILFVDAESKWYDFLEGTSQRGQELTEISPEHARKLVEGAVVFARSQGLQPCHEWPVASAIFGDIDATQCLTEFTFGSDGKPLFIQGPYDTPESMRLITQAMSQASGPETIIHLVADDDLDDEEMELLDLEDDVEVESEIHQSEM